MITFKLDRFEAQLGFYTSKFIQWLLNLGVKLLFHPFYTKHVITTYYGAVSKMVLKTWVSYKGHERTYIISHRVNQIYTSMTQCQIRTCVTDMNSN